MTETYRGHCIRVTRARFWDAVITHAESGVILPTKATAALEEGASVAIARACQLIDLYLDAVSAQRWNAA